MKKSVIIVLLLGMLLILPLVQAQTYSGFNKFTDNIKLFFSSGDNKVRLALEIREKELNSAMYNAQLGNDKEVIKNLESAINKLKIVQERVSPDTADEVKNNIDEVKNNIKENTNIDSDYFEKYLTEEEKTKLSADLSQKTFDYCENLAMQDYKLMSGDEKCKTYSWMEKKIEQRLNEEQEKSQNEIKNQIQICMNNPKDCNCDKISLFSEKKKCEEYKALTIKCEFQNDGSACKGIEEFSIEEREREEYEKQILEQYIPGECLEAGVKNGEECKKLIIAINKPESECMENGQTLRGQECEKKLVVENKIPEDCIKNEQVVSSEECKKILKEKSGNGEEMAEVSLKECTDAGYNTQAECENFILKQNLPQECVEAGALTPEACEKLKLPEKCQGEAYSREECDVIFIKEKMPPECQESGTYDFFKCAKILYAKVSDTSIESEIDWLRSKGITLDMIPVECLSDGTNFVRGMACDEALIKEFGVMLPPPVETSTIPTICMRGGTPVSPEECEELLNGEVMTEAVPEVCKEAEVSNPEECAELIEEQRLEQGIGINMPEECTGISAEECKAIMEEKGIKVEKIEQVQKVEKVEKVQKMCKEGEECETEPVEYEEVTIPKECIELGISDYKKCGISMSKINEERIKQGDEVIIDEEGNIDYITSEEISKLAEKAEKQSQDLKPDIEKAREIKDEIDDIERGIKEIEEKGITDEFKPASEIKGSSNVIDKPSMNKENEDATSAPNIVNNNVAPGPEGIVGVVESQDNSGSNSDDRSESGVDDDSGASNGITGAVIGSGNKESFLGKIIKRIFGI